MSEFIDGQDIAIRNRIAVDGRVNPTVEDWNNLLTHIDRLEQENAELREVLILNQRMILWLYDNLPADVMDDVVPELGKVESVNLKLLNK